MRARLRKITCLALALLLLTSSAPGAFAAFRKNVTGEEVYAAALELYVYERADVNSRVLEIVPYGKKLLRVDVRKDCAMVSTINNNVGYCYNSQLSVNNPNRYNTTVYSQTGHTPVYLRPSTKSPLLGHLTGNETVTMVAMTPQGEWLRVERDGYYGYVQKVRMDYSPFDPGQAAWCAAESTDVYYDPDLDSIIGTLYFGQPFKLVSRNGNWAKIRSGSGLVAYCSASAVTTVNPNAFNQTVYTQVSGNFLFVSSTDLSGRRMIDANEEMTLVAVDAGQYWARVKYNGGYYYLPYLFLGTERRLGDYKKVTAKYALNIFEGTKNSSPVVTAVPTGAELWLTGATDNYAKVTTLPDHNGVSYTGFVEIESLM